MREAVAGARDRRVRRDRRGARGRRSIASSETLEQRHSRRAPSSCIRSNLRAARSKLRARIASGIASKSRIGCSATISRPRSPAIVARVARLAAEESQIVLEDFDRAKTGLGGGARAWLRAPRPCRPSRSTIAAFEKSPRFSQIYSRVDLRNSPQSADYARCRASSPGSELSNMDAPSGLRPDAHRSAAGAAAAGHHTRRTAARRQAQARDAEPVL